MHNCIEPILSYCYSFIHSLDFAERFLPYSVTVTPRNITGNALSTSIDCFTQGGSK